jgi:hypothetical protein
MVPMMGEREIRRHYSGTIGSIWISGCAVITLYDESTRWPLPNKEHRYWV